MALGEREPAHITLKLRAGDVLGSTEEALRPIDDVEAVVEPRLDRFACFGNREVRLRECVLVRTAVGNRPSEHRQCNAGHENDPGR
jgi:hypothetical protein